MLHCSAVAYPEVVVLILLSNEFQWCKSWPTVRCRGHLASPQSPSHPKDDLSRLHSWGDADIQKFSVALRKMNVPSWAYRGLERCSALWICPSGGRSSNLRLGGERSLQIHGTMLRRTRAWRRGHRRKQISRFPGLWFRVRVGLQQSFFPETLVRVEDCAFERSI